MNKILLKTRKDLIQALTDKKLPCSTPTLNRFEDLGIIKTPGYCLKRNNNGLERLYTEKEIEVAVASVENYLKDKKKFGNK